MPKYTMELDEVANENLEKLQTTLGNPTKAGVLKMALALLQVILEIKGDATEVTVTGNNGTKTIVIT